MKTKKATPLLRTARFSTSQILSLPKFSLPLLSLPILSLPIFLLANPALAQQPKRVELDSYPMQAVKMAAAANPQTPPAVLESLSDSTDPLVRRALAGNPSIGEKVKNKLADDKAAAVVESLLRNSQLPSEAVLLKIVERGQPKLKETLAGHPACPPAVLSKLSQGPQFTEYLLLSLARNPKTPPEVMLHLTRIGDRLVRTFLAKSPRLSPQAFSQLANDGDLGVKSMLATNPLCPTDTLGNLSRDSHATVRVS